MRISNIRNYLGGADQVIALEVLNGNQFKQSIAISSIDFTSTDVSLDIDLELFQSAITQKGSKITIDDLTKVTVPAYAIRNTQETLVTDKANGSFNFIIPSDLISGFVTDTSGATVTAPTVLPDALNPFIVAAKVQWTITDALAPLNTEIRSLRFLFVVRYQPNNNA